MRHSLQRFFLLLILPLPVLPIAAGVLDHPGGTMQPSTRPAEDLPVLDVAFMVRGYFLAGSPVEDPEALGGFGESYNLPRKIDRKVPPHALSLIALPDELVPFGEYRGFRVMLANTTGEQVSLEATDSRLDIVREALDPDGEWKPVEYLPSSWCGNSYHRVFLPRGQAWLFAAPVYQGSLETRMRFVLLGTGEEAPIYSNEFEGSVNPEQFTVEQGHNPTNIMDPYVN